MKLITTIKPRADGTVKVQALDKDKTVIVFHENADGMLEAEVEHERTLQHLLALGDFEPADEADYHVATQLATPYQRHLRSVGAVAPQQHEAVVEGAARELLAPGPDDGDDDDGLDDADPNAGPIEAATPPKRFKPPRKARAAA